MRRLERKKRILLVDDDDSLRTMLVMALGPMGYEVIEARDGMEAIRLLKKGAMPDLVLTDIVMPEKEGLETVLEIKRDYPALKIVAMSGTNAIEGLDVLDVARKFGAARCLSKPFSIDELAVVLHEVFSS
jgi:CheY-like chemotaxis protein